MTLREHLDDRPSRAAAFQDRFARQDQDIEASKAWRRVGGRGQGVISRGALGFRRGASNLLLSVQGRRFGAAQFIETRIGQCVSGPGFVTLHLRESRTGGNFYRAFFRGDGSCGLDARINGANQHLATMRDLRLAPGDVLRFEAAEDNLRVLLNGALHYRRIDGRLDRGAVGVGAHDTQDAHGIALLWVAAGDL